MIALITLVSVSILVVVLGVYFKITELKHPTSYHITTETLRNKCPIKDSITDDDLIELSHKTANGYSSSAITLGELKSYIKGNWIE